MSNIQFSVGALFFNPNAGNLPSNQTPQAALTIQDVSCDFDAEVKELLGQYQYPDDVAVGNRKISGKFTVGRNDIDLFQNLFFADTLSAGSKQIAYYESHSIPATPGPYTVTVTNSANFSTDLGVQYATGKKLEKVATVSAAGQYSVAAGVYTFDAADQGVAVMISYTWTDATTGRTLAGVQHLMGYGPTFELWLAEPYQVIDVGASSGLHLFACKATKVNLDLKRDDYLKPVVNYSAFADPSGNVYEMFEG